MEVNAAVAGDTTFSRWKPYPEYKDSGVEWLGEIPAHWSIKRLKFLSSVPFQYGANEAANDDDPEMPRYIRITDIKEDGTLRDDTFRSLPEEIAKPYLLSDGDMLFARSGATVGKTFRYRASWGKACYAGYLIRFRANNKRVLPEFIDYFTSSKVYWEWVSSIFIQATIQNISAEKYANFIVSLPSLPEQHAIAAFLDRETTKIDTLIAKKRDLIALLQEQRSAIISHAVTKGLNPDAPMNDSGIEWLGEIPERWRIAPLKYVCSLLRDGTHQPPQRVLEGFPLLSVRNIVNGRFINLPDDSLISEEDFLFLQRSFKAIKDDVLLAIVGATLGKVAVVEEMPAFSIQRSLAVLRPKPPVAYFKFLYFFLQSSSFQQILWSNVSFSAQPGIYLGKLSSFQMVLPVIQEQIEIVNHIEAETNRIDEMVAKTEETIIRLQEYRSALISAAVTGKIDVRGEM